VAHTRPVFRTEDWAEYQAVNKKFADAAVQEVDGHPAVFVRLDEGLFELRSVHTGERAGADVEVLNGVAPGETVVVDGSFLLKGQLLRSTLGEDE